MATGTLSTVNRRIYLLNILILLIYLTLAILLLCIAPMRVEASSSLCIFNHIIGRECPGCGMTRAFAAMLHFQPTVAIAYNWKVLIVFPLMMWVVAKDSYNRIRAIITYLHTGI